MFIIFCILNLYSISQTNKYFYLNFSPLSLIDPRKNSYRFGLRIYPLKKISLEFDYRIGKINKNANYKLDNSLWQIRPSICYSLVRTEQFEFYTGFEFSYIEYKNIYKSYWMFISQRTLFFDYAEIFTTKETYNLKLGTVLCFGKFFYIDFYFGFGYFRKMMKVLYLENAILKDYFDVGITLAPGFVSGYCIVLNFKLGFRF